MKKYTQGFTLIELLVVIAIIGILSSVVLVSLNSARTKGKSARIQENASNLRTQLETDYNGADYSLDLHNAGAAAATNVVDDYTLFTATSNIGILKADIASQSGLLQVYENNAAASTPKAYAIYVAFVNAAASNGGGYCVDSTGNTVTLTGSVFTAASQFATCAGDTTKAL